MSILWWKTITAVLACKINFHRIRIELIGTSVRVLQGVWSGHGPWFLLHICRETFEPLHRGDCIDCPLLEMERGREGGRETEREREGGREDLGYIVHPHLQAFRGNLQRHVAKDKPSNFYHTMGQLRTSYLFMHQISGRAFIQVRIVQGSCGCFVCQLCIAATWQSGWGNTVRSTYSKLQHYCTCGIPRKQTKARNSIWRKSIYTRVVLHENREFSATPWPSLPNSVGLQISEHFSGVKQDVSCLCKNRMQAGWGVQWSSGWL